MDALEKVLGYRFKNAQLLDLALTHPSFSKENETSNYQRLEFLGDAILSAIIAEFLYKRFPEEREGFLARSKSLLTKGAYLSALSKKLHIMDFLKVSKIEHENGGHYRNAALEDAIEAIIGAIFLDSSYKKVQTVILSWFGNIDLQLTDLLSSENPKGKLQELHPQQIIKYEVEKEEGPSHCRLFSVIVSINDVPLGRGTGSSKKEAEEIAAKEALKIVKIEQ